MKTISYKVGDKVRLIADDVYFSSAKKFKKGAVGSVTRLLECCGAHFMFCPDGNTPSQEHSLTGSLACYADWVELVPEETAPEKPAARKLSEILQLAFDSGSYKVGQQDFMCHALDRMVENNLITSEESEATRSRIMKQVQTVYKNRYKKGLVHRFTGISLAGAFTKEDDAYKCAEQYFRKWIRDLKRRGN